MKRLTGSLLPLLAFALGFPSVALTEDSFSIHEVRIGLLNHDTDNLWSGLTRESGVDYNAELIFSPAWDLWKGTVRPNLGASINNHGDTSKLYAGGVWEYPWDNGLFLDLGLGGAIHDGEIETRNRRDKKELGSRFLFRIAIEVGLSLTEHHRLSLMFDHVSNGYVSEVNEGLDSVGLRYGFRF